MTGCSNELPEMRENRETVVDYEVYPSSEDDFDDSISIAAIYRDIMMKQQKQILWTVWKH